MSDSSPTTAVDSIGRNRSFLGHVGAQFFGAFNDNLFKQLVLFLAARQLFPGEDKQGLAFAVFALPFILFSGIAGDLSERISKRRIIVAMKVLEVAIMVGGAVVLGMSSWIGMLVVLFVMGAQSAFFGPSKYGVIPELVSKNRLLAANGMITMTTFLAILTGQALAGPLLDNYGDTLWITGAWCGGFAIVGTALAGLIKPLPPVAPTTKVSLNPFGSVFKSIKELKADKRVFPMLLLNSFFWFTGGVLQQAIAGLGGPGYLDIPEGETTRLSLLLVTLAVSIILGSVMVPQAGKIMRRGKMVAFGAITMTLGTWVLTVVTSTMGGTDAGYYTCHAVLAVIGFSGAFFAVPVQTFLQDAPVEGTRGKAFAVNNFLNFTFIFLAGIFYIITSMIGLHPGAAAGIAGCLMVAFLGVVRGAVGAMDEEKPDSDAVQA